jgi:hypothetical protein
VPPGAGNRLAVLLADARLVVIPEGPHAIIWTHAAEVNQALLGFLLALLPAARLVSDLTARCSQHADSAAFTRQTTMVSARGGWLDLGIS